MKKTDQNQAGFTLTEMLLALAVASILIVSVGQLLSLTARAYHRVTGSVETLREYRSLDRFLSLLEAADSDAGSLAPDALVVWWCAPLGQPSHRLKLREGEWRGVVSSSQD